MNLFAVCLAITLFANTASAQVVRRELPEAAKLCINCHSQTTQQQATPDAQLIPLLGAQQPKYLDNAILAYARRQRDHFFMRGVSAGLSTAERAEVVNYFASAPSSSKQPSAKVQMPSAAVSCVACHGDASSPPAAEDIPRLAGQHQTYLQGAFLNYAKGARRHPVMQSIASDAQGAPTISPEDLALVTRWFSGLPGGVSGD